MFLQGHGAGPVAARVYWNGNSLEDGSYLITFSPFTRFWTTYIKMYWDEMQNDFLHNCYKNKVVLQDNISWEGDGHCYWKWGMSYYLTPETAQVPVARNIGHINNMNPGNITICSPWFWERKLLHRNLLTEGQCIFISHQTDYLHVSLRMKYLSRLTLQSSP